MTKNFLSPIVAIIQARTGSSRLPRKVLMNIAGLPMLQIIIDRVKACPEIDKVVVATTTDPEDDVLVNWIDKVHLCDVFRGSQDDVLSRYYECAARAGARVVVRVTADDPLKDPAVISSAISHLAADPSLDYCSNTLSPTYPEGLDIEVFRFEALERAHRQATLASDREHVTPYIWKNPDLFKLKNFEFERNLSAWRWTVDKPADLEFARTVFEAFGNNPLVSYLDVIALIDKQPQLAQINAGTVRNEGYLKSIGMENL